MLPVTRNKRKEKKRIELNDMYLVCVVKWIMNKNHISTTMKKENQIERA